MKNSERGSALVLATFVLLILTAMGLALVALSHSEMLMNRGDLRAKHVFYVAEAGLEDARLSLLATEDGDWTNDLQAVAGANGVIDFDPTLIEAAIVDSDGVLTGLQFSATVDDTPLRDPVYFASAEPPGWYLVYLTNDAAETTQVTTDSNDRVMLTAVGVGSRLSMEVVQAIIEPDQPLPSVPQAAITMLGETPPSFDNGNSNAQSHIGDDCGVPGAAYVPIVGAVTDAGRAQIQSDAHQLDSDHFNSGPYGGEDTIANLADAADPVVGGNTIDPLWLDCESLKQLVIDLTALADYYCNTDTMSCDPPAMSAGQITVIDGDFTANTDSEGLLLVTGELTYWGNTQWDGIVLVIGEGRMLRSGGGNGQPDGGVVIANVDPSIGGPYATKIDWCTEAGIDGFGQASYDTSGGGSSEVTYCSENIDASNPVDTYEITEFLQR